jgi:hypothetical protein
LFYIARPYPHKLWVHGFHILRCHYFYKITKPTSPCEPNKIECPSQRQTAHGTYPLKFDFQPSRNLPSWRTTWQLCGLHLVKVPEIPPFVWEVVLRPPVRKESQYYSFENENICMQTNPKKMGYQPKGTLSKSSRDDINTLSIPINM